MVGCGRPDCAESGADYCGYWEPIPEKVDGRFVAGVRRFPSALERAMSSGEMVIVGDLLDRAETRPSRVVTLPEYLPPLVA